MSVQWLDAQGNRIGSRIMTAAIKTLTDAWQQATDNLIAPDGTAAVQVFFEGTKGGVGRSLYLDDIYIGTPPPTVPITAPLPPIHISDPIPPPVTPAILRGPVYTWGSNSHGELGDGSKEGFTTVPVLIPLTGITAMAGGMAEEGQSMVLMGDGTVRTWGFNAYGQIGDGTVAYAAYNPRQVEDLAGVCAIASSAHSVAALDDGTVWAWGYNDSGQLGDASATYRNTRGKVLDLTGVKAVATGVRHTLALLNDGTVWSWGRNAEGQLGDSSTATSYVRRKVCNLKGVKAIAAGYAFNLALLGDDTVYAWGQGLHGQLGNGTGVDNYPLDPADKSTPAKVVNLAGVKAIAAGHDHALALLKDGTVYSWGLNLYGQGGYGQAVGFTTTPLRVVHDPKNPTTTALTGVTAIAAGHFHSLALLGDGTVCAWGLNSSGQLGNGDTGLVQQPTPVTVKNLAGVKAIAAGVKHSLACCDQPLPAAPTNG